MRIKYTIHNCVTVDGADREVCFDGEEAADKIAVLSKYITLTNDTVGHYIPDFGITIEEINFDG